MKVAKSYLVFGLLLGAAAFSTEVPLLYLNHHSLLPGQTLKIQFPTRGKEPPTLTWGPSVFTFLQTPDHFWRVLVPVPMDQPTGRASLYINTKTAMPSDVIDGPLEIDIDPSSYGQEDIQFSQEKSKLLNDPAEEEESKLLREMINAAISDPLQRWRGLFSPPVLGPVISKFGMTRNKRGQKQPDFHRGVDLAGDRGDPVLAPNNGVVLLVKEFYFHGKTVLMSHGQGVATIYIHLKQIDVKEGQVIQKGQRIGEVGSTGLATGPHLHWGLYVQGQPVDPIQWLSEEF